MFAQIVIPIDHEKGQKHYKQLKTIVNSYFFPKNNNCYFLEDSFLSLSFFTEQSAVIKLLLHIQVAFRQIPFPLQSFGHKLFPISCGGAKFPFASRFQ